MLAQPPLASCPPNGPRRRFKRRQNDGDCEEMNHLYQVCALPDTLGMRIPTCNLVFNCAPLLQRGPSTLIHAGFLCDLWLFCRDKSAGKLETRARALIWSAEGRQRLCGLTDNESKATFFGRGKPLRIFIRTLSHLK